MKTHPLFVGYPRLEAWAAVADPTRPVYAAFYSQPVGRDTGGPLVYDLCVLTAQPDADGIVHYCCLKAAFVTLLDGQPFGTDAPTRYQAQTDVSTLVRDWLIERGFTLREGVFDTPRDAVPLNGQAGFVTWDRETRRYIRTDHPDKAEEPPVAREGETR